MWLTIRADGRYHYEGSRVEGDGVLPEAQLRALLASFEAARFLDLCSTVGHEWTDFPSINLEYWDGARHKRVETYLGNDVVAAHVVDLAKEVDRVTGMDVVIAKQREHASVTPSR